MESRRRWRRAVPATRPRKEGSIETLQRLGGAHLLSHLFSALLFCFFLCRSDGFSRSGGSGRRCHSSCLVPGFFESMAEFPPWVLACIWRVRCRHQWMTRFHVVLTRQEMQQLFVPCASCHGGCGKCDGDVDPALTTQSFNLTTHHHAATVWKILLGGSKACVSLGTYAPQI